MSDKSPLDPQASDPQSQSNSAMSAPNRTPIARAYMATFLSVGVYVLIISGLVYATLVGAESMGYNWQWYQIPKYLYTFTDEGFAFGELIHGLVATIQLSVIAFMLALGVGLLVAILRLSDLITGQWLSKFFLELMRNTPLLVLLYLFYYVLGPVFGWDRFSASVICLGLFHAALISEIFRAGINAIPKGQWEAASSIGMTKFQAYRHVILPQSIRFILPPLTGEVVHMVKSSAIVSVIAVVELTTIGRNIISDTYLSFEIWFTIAAIYLVFTTILSLLSSMVERRFDIQGSS